MNTRKTPRTRTITGTLVVLLIAGLATVALAQGPGQGFGGQGNGRFGDFEGGPQLRLERMAERLELTADQVAAIEKIRDAGRAENLQLRKEMMRLRNEKQGEMLKDEPSTKTVLALTRKMGDLRTEMQANRMENRLAVRKLLTPAQRDKMLMFGEGRGGWHGKGAGCRQGGHRRGDCAHGGPQGPRGQRGPGGHGSW